ncbi:MAG: twin-arginine translocase subunit TatC [Bacteroidales bacterium]|nr:twin-arginine translocase subunit TatC [Bacteroidales bacterium]NLK80050.1 twin-arginine translocase subunit TatC [Bacteroidales bacterium]HKM30591.1 twin-arginine translocase subunit TatC [Bacteroidales bacterium]
MAAETPLNDTGMSFWEHLEEFRKVLIRSVIVLLVLMVVIFLNKTFVFETIIFAPRSSDFVFYKWLESLSRLLNIPSMAPEPFKLELQNIELAAQFFTHINISLSLALVLGTPFILYQLWLFVKPALYEKERKAAVRAFAWCSFLFFLGVLAGYFFVFPLTINFLGNYRVTDWVENQITLQSYIHMFTWLILIMGIVFEMPVLLRVLSKIGIISKDFLKKHRKHAFVILLILAAVITPSGDAFTLFIVTVPLYLLYEASILVSYNKKSEEDEKVAV